MIREVSFGNDGVDVSCHVEGCIAGDTRYRISFEDLPTEPCPKLFVCCGNRLNIGGGLAPDENVESTISAHSTSPKSRCICGKVVIGLEFGELSGSNTKNGANDLICALRSFFSQIFSNLGCKIGERCDNLCEEQISCTIHFCSWKRGSVSCIGQHHVGLERNRVGLCT